MYKWLFLFTALLPGLAVGGLNSGATISYNEDGRELTLKNGDQRYWWEHYTGTTNTMRFYLADLSYINNGSGFNPDGQNGFLLEYPSTWTSSPRTTISLQSFKFFSNNGVYNHNWPVISNIPEGDEFSVSAPYATNNQVLTFTSRQADGNYSTTLRYMGAWYASSGLGVPNSIPTKYIKTSTVPYYVLNGQVYFGTMVTSCDVTNPGIEIDFGSVPPGTNTIENKTARLNIQCDASARIRISIQGDEYYKQYAVKRGELADFHLTLGDCQGQEAHTCEWTTPNGIWDMPLVGVINTKNRAGTFEGHFVITVELV